MVAFSALLYSANTDNQLLTENVLDPNGQINVSCRVRGTDGEQAYFYYYGSRGSTTAIVDPIGNVVAVYV